MNFSTQIFQKLKNQIEIGIKIQEAINKLMVVSGMTEDEILNMIDKGYNTNYEIMSWFDFALFVIEKEIDKFITEGVHPGAIIILRDEIVEAGFDRPLYLDNSGYYVPTSGQIVRDLTVAKIGGNNDFAAYRGCVVANIPISEAKQIIANHADKLFGDEVTSLIYDKPIFKELKYRR